MSIPKQKNIVGLRELRENMDEYISLVNKGVRITIVRRSKPVFTLAPVDSRDDEGEWEQIIDFTKIKRGGVDIRDILKRL